MAESKHTFRDLPSFSRTRQHAEDGSTPLTMDKSIIDEYFSPFSRMTALSDEGLIKKAWKRFTK